MSGLGTRQAHAGLAGSGRPSVRRRAALHHVLLAGPQAQDKHAKQSMASRLSPGSVHAPRQAQAPPHGSTGGRARGMHHLTLDPA